MDDSTSLASTSFESAAQGFAALGDPTRLAILAALGPGVHCVCELRDRVVVAPNLLSYHLRILRQAGLVEATRRGRWVDYRLSQEGLTRLALLIPSGSPR